MSSKSSSNVSGQAPPALVLWPSSAPQAALNSRSPKTLSRACLRACKQGRRRAGECPGSSGPRRLSATPRRARRRRCRVGAVEVRHNGLSGGRKPRRARSKSSESTPNLSAPMPSTKLRTGTPVCSSGPATEAALRAHNIPSNFNRPRNYEKRQCLGHQGSRSGIHATKGLTCGNPDPRSKGDCRGGRDLLV